MFDGSSIRGFQQIHESDMQLLPDPSTAVLDPFRTHKTLNLTFFVHDPLTGEPYSQGPAQHRPQGRRTTCAAPASRDTAFFGPEAEFYIFDSVALLDLRERGLLPHRLARGALEHRREEDGGNLGYKPRYKGGYFPVPPMDHYTDLRVGDGPQL